MHKLLIDKMSVKYNDPVDYYIQLGDYSLSVNDLIGKKISINWLNTVFCSCGRKMKKFYRQSFCYDCFWNSPEASPSIFKPELCTAHLNIEERDLEWEKKFQLQPHLVYLSISSGLKVGVTRKNSLESRWIDQGAIEGIVFAETPNRYLAGKIEIFLKNYVADRTSWMKMLKGDINKVDLIIKKNELSSYLNPELKKYVINKSEIKKINFPINKLPNKVKSIVLDKKNIPGLKLVGIKGQYLIFDNDEVFNVRRHKGYLVDFFTS
ncbi:MAG: hypothetical protein CMP74_01675 [Flavobacteriales bacterium]|nr:hypothetical protein [Flavobacteriales bacterium]|tara:strand:- start:2747 stop:3541 length:795 start_codon:yes stop_codon:yes gene_type:complete